MFLHQHFVLDCGEKYLSQDFKIFCEKHGIRCQLTQPRTPQQNRMAKHKNQT
jgi:hypothetical protein